MSAYLSVNQIEQMKQWAKDAGRIALDLQPSAVERMKADDTPVTNADVQVEHFLVERIRRAFPMHQVLAEESGLTGPDSDWLWAVDPIDGTKSFIRRLPVWGVSIGVLYMGNPVAGVIYLPVSQDLFWGWQSGAYWNDMPLHARAGQPFDDPMLYLAVHSNAHYENDILYPRIQAYGSTAAHLAFLAAGQAVGVLSRRVHIWDLAAALPILHQAGYQAEYISGAPFDLSKLFDGRKTSEEILATRPEWMACLKGMIRRKPAEPGS